MIPMKTPANILGPQIRRLRFARGWSQAKFASKLQMKGLDIGREVVAQIESQTHCLKDKDIPVFAEVLKVQVAELYLFAQNGQGSAAGIMVSVSVVSGSKPAA